MEVGGPILSGAGTLGGDTRHDTRFGSVRGEIGDGATVNRGGSSAIIKPGDWGSKIGQ